MARSRFPAGPVLTMRTGCPPVAATRADRITQRRKQDHVVLVPCAVFANCGSPSSVPIPRQRRVRGASRRQRTRRTDCLATRTEAPHRRSPCTARAEPDSRERNHNRDWPSAVATKAMVRPSGEMASDMRRCGRRRSDVHAHLGRAGVGRGQPYQRQPPVRASAQPCADPREPLAAASDPHPRPAATDASGSASGAHLESRSAHRRCRGAARCGSFSRHRRSSRRIDGGVSLAMPPGRARAPAPRPGRRTRSSPANARRPVSIS